jgi:prepilin-type N-terminal cleavage/methylation domain-containing protein
MALSRVPDSSRPQRAASRRRSGKAAGFALLEVLIAMIILAVGLMALQALSIAAVHRSAAAEQNTRAALIASRYLEEALEQLRREQLPASFACTLENGDQVSRSVATEGSSRLARVTVEVTPDARSLPPYPYVIHAHAYSTQGFQLPAPVFTCP